MTSRFASRVAEISLTTGTGAFVLGGAQAGFRAISTAFGDNIPFYYEIKLDPAWEIGLGYTVAGSLVRATVLDSSNGGSLVSFGAGTKSVFCVMPAQAMDAIPKTYAIDVEDTQGASSTTEDAFTPQALVPAYSFLVGDEVSGRLVVEIGSNLVTTPQLTVRSYIGGALIDTTIIAPAYIFPGFTVEMTFRARVYAIGGDLVLRALTKQARVYVGGGSTSPLLDVVDGYMAGLSGGGPTTGSIAAVGTVQFDASHAGNEVVVRALSLTHWPRMVGP